MDVTSIKYFDLPPLDDKGYASLEHVEWIEGQFQLLLWSIEKLAEEAGLSKARLNQLDTNRIPGAVKLAGRRYFIAAYARLWCEHRKANPPKRGRVAKAPVAGEGAQGKPAKPKVARVPAYIKKVQQDTPHLIVNDHNVPVDAPGVSSMHHHWADLQGYSEVPKRLEKWRRFKFQGMSCIVPLRYKHPKHFSFALLQDIGRYFPQFCVLSNNLDYGFDLTDKFRTYSRHPHADTAFADDPGYAVFKQFMALREEAWNIRDKIKSIYIGM